MDCLPSSCESERTFQQRIHWVNMRRPDNPGCPVDSDIPQGSLQQDDGNAFRIWLLLRDDELTRCLPPGMFRAAAADVHSDSEKGNGADQWWMDRPNASLREETRVVISL